MTKEQLDRISALSRKSRAEGLTPEEKQEQETLRRAYIDEFKRSLRQTLDNTYFVDADGNQRKAGQK